MPKKTNKYDEEIEAIPDTPENIVRAITQGPPAKEWDFMKESRGKSDEGWRRNYTRSADG